MWLYGYFDLVFFSLCIYVLIHNVIPRQKITLALEILYRVVYKNRKKKITSYISR